ncbi:AAA family ATPase [uncultured Desulfovibrio sp.]|uniref:nucleotide-binding protein n=1 Tax=uncultured Desulfovibrio sp. TaxID=167968 RepID=UPI0025DDECB4|nr:AAA family ATPase [uncultured Desulfovibrio sp.]
MGLPIYYVGGSKGGVGKSLFSLILVEYLLSKNKKVLLFDADMQNRDLFLAFENDSGTIATTTVDLDSSSEWLRILSFIEKHGDHHVVINSAANNTDGTLRYGPILLEGLPELKREMFFFWLLNRQRDSLNKFSDLKRIFSSAKIFAVRNLYFGNQEKFSFFNSSSEKKELEDNKKDNRVFDFPEMADRVAESISNERLSIGNGIKNLSLGERCELKRWRKLCFEVFDGIPGLQQHE